MKKIFLFLFSIISISLIAQHANTKFMMIFEDCQLEGFKTKADKAPSFMGGTEELSYYFTTHCKKHMSEIVLEGKIFIQVLIDNAGNPCCRQIANKTGEDISELELKKAINEMPVWEAAVIDSNKVNFSAFLILTLSNGQCKVTYNKSEKTKEKKEYNIPYYSIDGALKHIEHANILNLLNKELKELDPDIGKLIYLTELNLAQNQLKKLPKEIGQLSKLELLYISGNQLESLPSQIGELVNLKALLLNKNQLKSLPKEIGKLKNLRMLNVSDNKMSEKTIEKIKALLPDCHVIN